MGPEPKTRSKFLSYLLRHKPEALNLTMDSQGWVSIAEIIKNSAQPVSYEQITKIVRLNNKQRFELSNDGSRIRASQGHSIDVDLQLAPQEPPETLFHGTAEDRVEQIRTQGLIKGSRQHVHLSPDPDTARTVGQRHGRPVVLRVKSGEMQAAGHLFYLSKNGVWLCDHVPPEFLE
jgi:putative RNA 2'-phosphotransferase